MQIEILGAESLVVRGLSCFVRAGERRILIDPGVALGYLRHGLLPHPFQVAVGARVRESIISALGKSTDVVFSHFHGDHVPLADANPYQLALSLVAASMAHTRLCGPDPTDLGQKMGERRAAIISASGREVSTAEGMSDDTFTFSRPMPHGEHGNGLGTVMMTRIEHGGEVFVHASDIQLLERRPIKQIIDWQPDVVLAGGPPLYLRRLSSESQKRAWDNARTLARNVPTLILDHHLLRSKSGADWLSRLKTESTGAVVCAADFMHVPRRFLEAWRRQLYRELPVPKGWHEKYARKEVDTQDYLAWRDFLV